MLDELVQFFRERNLSEVAEGLKADLDAKKRASEAEVLASVRKAVVKVERADLVSKGTRERDLRPAARKVETLPKEETERIMEDLMTKMVQRPTAQQQLREKELNKRIEKVFELESFQRMVENAEDKSFLSELATTKSFISQSESIQKSMQEQYQFKNIMPTHSELVEEDLGQEELPHFGNTQEEIKFDDPMGAEHDEIQNLIGKIQSQKIETEAPQPVMLSNDDSFSNIAPAVEEEAPEAPKKIEEPKKEDKKPVRVPGDDIEQVNLNAANLEKEEAKGEKEEDDSEELEPEAPKKPFDIDDVVKQIFESEGLQPGKVMYDMKVLHSKNPEFKDEYVDEDDPGFDTYVVNEENFVASCQELARLNDFPFRAIEPDTKHDMATRERHRREQQAIKDKIRDAKKKKESKRLKNNDSALLL